MLPAAAAGIAFAADVSAKVKLTGSVFDYNADTKETSALTLKNHTSHDWEPDMELTFSGEKAGATVKYKTLNEWGNGSGETTTAWKIWLKPIDMLTMTIGSWDTTLNQESIDYSKSKSGIGSAGFTFSLAPVDGFTFDATLAPGFGNKWFDKTDGNDATLAELGFKAAYSADFGTISGIFDAKDTFKTLKFGAGFNGNFGPVSSFVNVLGLYGKRSFGDDDDYADKVDHLKDGKEQFQGIRAEIFASTSFDALGLKLFVPVNINLWDGASDDIKTMLDAGFSFRADYNVGGYDLYLKVVDFDLLKDNFSMLVKPGVGFSVGECGIDLSLEFTAQEKIKIAVPVEFTVNF